MIVENKRMKQIKTFRRITFCAFLLLIIKVVLIDYQLNYRRFSSNALKFFEDTVLIQKYWGLLHLGNVVHYLILLLIGVGLSYSLKHFSNKNRSLLALLSIAINFIIAYLLAKIDFWINPYFFLIYESPIETEILSLFNHTFVRNSIQLLAVTSIVFALDQLENSFIRTVKTLQIIRRLPISVFVLTPVIPLLVLALLLIEMFSGDLLIIAVGISMMLIATALFTVLSLVQTSFLA